MSSVGSGPSLPPPPALVTLALALHAQSLGPPLFLKLVRLASAFKPLCEFPLCLVSIPMVSTLSGHGSVSLPRKRNFLSCHPVSPLQPLLQSSSFLFACCPPPTPTALCLDTVSSVGEEGPPGEPRHTPISPIVSGLCSPLSHTNGIYLYYYDVISSRSIDVCLEFCPRRFTLRS